LYCAINSFVSILDGLLHPQATQRWSIDKVCSCHWLENQTLLPEVEPFPANLTNYWTSVHRDAKKSESTSDCLRSASSFEDEVQSKMEDLGITSELIQKRRNGDHAALSNRDCINGTYRIILHRLQKQSNPIEREDLSEKTMNEDLAASWGRSMSVHGEPVGQVESSNKVISFSYGGTTTRTKRPSQRTTESRKTNPNSYHQQTKVCTIL
jgi:uncharacterized protein